VGPSPEAAMRIYRRARIAVAAKVQRRI